MSCEPAAVAWARRWASAELTSIYAGLGESLPDIETVVSELVTNAVRADCHRLTLELDAHHTYVRIATSDDAPGTPVKQQPTAELSRGRGLLIVDALSTRWGVDRQERGKTVWAEITLSGASGATFACDS